MKNQKCKKCGSKNIVSVEYNPSHPEHYDGISEIVCQDCDVRFGRWSGKELANGESEKRYGKDTSNLKEYIENKRLT